MQEDIEAQDQDIAAKSDAALESGNTPLEDHIAQDSPLQRMARDTRRIDGMAEGLTSSSGVVSSASILHKKYSKPCLLHNKHTSDMSDKWNVDLKIRIEQ